MSEFPSTADIQDSTKGAAFFQSLWAQWKDACEELSGGQVRTELTISGGTIAPTHSSHTVDTESNAATDFLDNISTANIKDGSLVLLRAEDAARVVTVRHDQGGAGEMQLRGGASYEMDSLDKILLLERVGTTWYEVMRVSTLTDELPHGSEVFSASGNFTVPASITDVYVTIVGGGGGGGGGGSPGVGGGDGAAGVAGSTTTFAALASAPGGSGGGLGLALARGGAGGYGGNNGETASSGTAGRGGLEAATMFHNNGAGGAGGAGGDGAAVDGGGGGGSGGISAAAVIKTKLSGLTPGQIIAVTIGAGGAGGAAGTGGDNDGTAGSTGNDGFLVVEW